MHPTADRLLVGVQQKLVGFPHPRVAGGGGIAMADGGTESANNLCDAQFCTPFDECYFAN